LSGVVSALAAIETSTSRGDSTALSPIIDNAVAACKKNAVAAYIIKPLSVGKGFCHVLDTPAEAPVTDTPTDLMNPSAASAALAELATMLDSATTLLEVNSIQRKAEALRRVLEVARADALWQNRFCAQRCRSMLKLGAMLSEADLHKGGRPSANEKPLTEGEGFKLVDAGISYRLSSECQKIFHMPRERFDGYLARGEQCDEDGIIIEISKSGLLAEAARAEAQSEPEADAGGIDSSEKQLATIIPLTPAINLSEKQLQKTPAEVAARIAEIQEWTAADKIRRDAAAGIDSEKNNLRKKPRSRRSPSPPTTMTRTPIRPRSTNAVTCSPTTPNTTCPTRQATRRHFTTGLRVTTPIANMKRQCLGRLTDSVPLRSRS
jgi:hypothetical protein